MMTSNPGKIFGAFLGKPRLALLLLMAVPLGGCATYWSEAPGRYDVGGGYYGGYGAPGWWGSDVASVNIFYSSLNSWGGWHSDPYYGRVWMPRGVGAGWRPYMLGHWGADRRWVSSEPFGWATYHYGRWGHDRRGWFWVPDTRYGHSWVQWENRGSNVRWAPLPPRGWDRGDRVRGNNWWMQAPRDRISRPDLGRELARRHNYNYRPQQSRPRPVQVQQQQRPRVQWQRPGTGPTVDQARRERDKAIPNPVRPNSVRPNSVRPGQVRPDRVRPGQTRPDHVRPGQVRQNPARAEQIRAREARREQARQERAKVNRPPQVRPDNRASERPRVRWQRPSADRVSPDRGRDGGRSPGPMRPGPARQR